MNESSDLSPQSPVERVPAGPSSATPLAPKAYLGLHAAVGFLATAVGLFIFGGLIEEVLENAAIVQWDVSVDAWIHGLVTPFGVRLLLFATFLGSPTFMAALFVIGGIVLWRKHRRTLLIGWAVAFIGGGLVDAVVKLAVHRARPTYGTAYLHGHTYSFPSGHAMGSLIGYGMLAYVTGQLWHTRHAWRVFAYALAAVLVLLVGVSRLYLGVHWPTDVIGGYAAGAAWLAICVTGVSIAQGRARDEVRM